MIVHGNHDRLDEMEAFSRKTGGFHLLHGRSVEICGVNFFGLGGEIPSRSDDDWNAAETEEAATEMLARLEEGAVLITHTPPFGQADLQGDGTHEGSRAIRDRIATAQPRLALCGHIHYAWGMTGMIGATPVQNLGPRLNRFEL